MAERVAHGVQGADDGAGRIPRTGVVRLPGPPQEREEAFAALGLAGQVVHPHLAPLLSLDDSGVGAVVVHALERGASALGAWTSAGPLSPGQVVTLGVPLGQALHALHLAGLAAGPLDVDDVVVAPDGRPELVARHPRALGAGGVAEEVAGLAAFLRDLMADRSAPAALAMLLVRAADPGDAVASDADAFAAALVRCTRPEPLVRPAAGSAQSQVPPPQERHEPSTAEQTTAGLAEVPADPIAGLRRAVRQTEPVRPGGLRPRSRPAAPAVTPAVAQPQRARRGVTKRRRGAGARGWAAAGTLVALVVALGAAALLRTGPAAPESLVVVREPSTASAPAAGVETAGALPEPAEGSAPPTGPGQRASVPTGVGPVPSAAAAGVGEWAGVLAALDARRAVALAAADRGGLASVVVPGSPADHDDSITVEALRAAGLRARGLGWTVDSVSVVSRSASAVTLRVVDRARAYVLVDPAGRVRSTRPSRGPRTWAVGLRREPGAPWRVWSVVPA